MGYKVLIGLEMHCEISNTKTKVFSSAINGYSEKANTNIRPVDMAFPGTLPTVNKEAVRLSFMASMILGCTQPEYLYFERKNYYYPDLPKGFQITQETKPAPIGSYGELEYEVNGEKKKVRINNLHLEEDAASSDHYSSGSRINYNRAGVPLLELVTEPDFRSADEAVAFLETMRSIYQYANISEADSKKGQVRCDVNVSVREKGSEVFGTRCEMKNVNSFSAAVRGIEYETKRQIEVLESGGTVVQETRRWDDAKGMSIVMRSKEDAQDYRYFPEPDLLTIVVPEEKIQALKDSLPELPNVKLERYVFDFGLSQMDATLIAEDISRSTLFDACVSLGTVKPKSVSNWILSDIAKYTNETGKSIEETALTPEHLTALIEQVEKGVISNASAKKVFAVIVEEDKDPVAIIEEKGMKQNSDVDFLEQLARDVLAQNEKSVNDYKNGKTNALGYLVGQCMKASKGKANPGIIKEIVTKMLQA